MVRLSPLPMLVGALAIAGASACGGAAPTSGSPPATPIRSSPTSASSSTISSSPLVPTSSTVFPAATPTAGASMADVVVIDCDPNLARREPTTFVLTCADEGETLTHLVWSRWAPAGAEARGTLSMHDCTPSCASSSRYVDYPATLVLSGVVTPAGGTPHFSHAVATLGGSWHVDYPGGTDPQTFSLPTH